MQNFEESHSDGFQLVKKKQKRVRASYNVFGMPINKGRTFRIPPHPGRYTANPNPSVPSCAPSGLPVQDTGTTENENSEESDDTVDEGNRFSSPHGGESPIQAYNSSTSEGRAKLQLLREQQQGSESLVVSQREEGLSTPVIEVELAVRQPLPALSQSQQREDSLPPLEPLFNSSRTNSMPEPTVLQERRRKSSEDLTHYTPLASDSNEGNEEVLSPNSHILTGNIIDKSLSSDSGTKKKKKKKKQNVYVVASLAKARKTRNSNKTTLGTSSISSVPQ